MSQLIFSSVAGILTGLVLLAVGFVLGRNKTRRESFKPLLDLAERDRLLELILQLERWAQRYSGDVSEYQEKLVGINDTLSRSGNGSDNQFMRLLTEIMQNNDTLQQRLEKAEGQLEQQTRQIQGYLSEARTDGLTGLSNRRALDKQLDEMFSSYRDGGRSFVLTLIDIDKFKSINDTHGHPVGDQVLKQIAQILRTSVPDCDMVARFGGEEFAILMPGPLRVAADRVNDLRKQIESHCMETAKGSLSVTASMGLAEPRNDSIVAPLLRRADEALYAAKNVGRNRVYYHDGTKPTVVGAPEVISS